MNFLDKIKTIKEAVFVNNGILELIEDEDNFFLSFNDKTLFSGDRDDEVKPMDIFLNLKRNLEMSRAIVKSYPIFISDENLFFYFPLGHIKKENNGVMKVSWFENQKLEERRYEIIRKYTCCTEVKGIYSEQ